MVISLKEAPFFIVLIRPNIFFVILPLVVPGFVFHDKPIVCVSSLAKINFGWLVCHPTDPILWRCVLWPIVLQHAFMLNITKSPTVCFMLESFPNNHIAQIIWLCFLPIVLSYIPNIRFDLPTVCFMLDPFLIIIQLKLYDFIFFDQLFL